MVWEFKLNEGLMAHSLLLFGANGKTDHVLHRQQGCQAAPSDHAENITSQHWGEGKIGRKQLQLSDFQPSSASQNGKVLKQTH